MAEKADEKTKACHALDAQGKFVKNVAEGDYRDTDDTVCKGRFLAQQTSK
ncbi:MAG: hypothetical protein ACRBB0_07775 [Pelagimonas sp.]